MEELSIHSVKTIRTKIKTCITEATKETLGTRRVNINVQNRKTSWFAMKIKQLPEETKKAHLEYKSLQSQQASVSPICSTFAGASSTIPMLYKIRGSNLARHDILVRYLYYFEFYLLLIWP